MEMPTYGQSKLGVNMKYKIQDSLPIVWTIEGRTYPPVIAKWVKTHTVNSEDVFELHRTKVNRETGEETIVPYFLTLDDLKRMVPAPSDTVEITIH